MGVQQDRMGKEFRQKEGGRQVLVNHSQLSAFRTDAPGETQSLQRLPTLAPFIEAHLEPRIGLRDYSAMNSRGPRVAAMEHEIMNTKIDGCGPRRTKRGATGQDNSKRRARTGTGHGDFQTGQRWLYIPPDLTTPDKVGRYRLVPR